MDARSTACRWVTAGRAALTTVAAALTVFAVTLVLKRVDAVIPQTRDVILGLLGLALVLTAGAIDSKACQDSTPDTVPMERTPWHEYEGSFRGMIG